MRNTNSSRARSTGQCSAMTCHPSAHRAVCTRVLCLTVDTRVPRFCVGPRLVAILLNTYEEEIFLSPSAITTVSWQESAICVSYAYLATIDPGYKIFNFSKGSQRVWPMQYLLHAGT